MLTYKSYMNKIIKHQTGCSLSVVKAKTLGAPTDIWHTHTHTHTHLTALCPSIPGWAGSNLHFTVLRDSEWQCHQLGHMQLCTSLQTDNNASTPSLSFYKHWRHIKLKLDWHKSKAKLTATFTALATFCALVVVCMNIHMLHQYLLSWKTFLTLATDVDVYWAVCLLAAIQPTSACKRFVTCGA